MACPMIPYTTGTDHELFNNLKIGATTLGSWPDNFYHSSEDTPDKVDPTQLHRAVVIGLTAITTLAHADTEQAQDFARLSLIYGRRRIAASEFSAVKSLLSGSKDDFGEADRLAENLTAHVYRRERAAIGSAAVFARTAKARSDVERTMSLLNSDEAASRKKVDEVASLRAVELNAPRAQRSLTEAERRAARLIPARNKGKELFNLSYVTRTLAKDSTVQIPKIEALELYFRAFEKAGVMMILEK